MKINLKASNFYLAARFEEQNFSKHFEPLELKEFSKDYFMYFIYYSPGKINDPYAIKQNKKFLETFHFNSKNTNYRLVEIFNLFDIKVESVFVFDSYTTNKKDKSNLFNKFYDIKGPCCFLKVNSSCVESLFRSIRNSICHMNIYTKTNDNYYYFLSINKNGYIDFFLRINKLQFFKKVANYIDGLKNLKIKEK